MVGGAAGALRLYIAVLIINLGTMSDLIQCTACNNHVAKKAVSCPHCGQIGEDYEDFLVWTGRFQGILALGLVILPYGLGIIGGVIFLVLAIFTG